MTIVKLPESNLELLFNYSTEYQNELSQFLESQCFSHETFEWRKLRTSNGGYQVRRQCLTCGHVIGGARKHSADDASLHWIDAEAQTRYGDSRKIEADAILEKHALLQANQGIIARYEMNKRLRDRLFVFDGTKNEKKRLDAFLGVGVG